MILLVAFYEEKDASRRAEFLECLRRNTANHWIDEVHVFVEESRPPEALVASYPVLADRKIRLIAHGRRVTYQDLFAYANRCLAGHGVIIANADIYFDHTLARLVGYDLAERLLCLSRWDVQPDGSARFFDHPASQDAWMFQAPIRAFPCNFHLGLLACDNRLAWEAGHAGLRLSNPSRSVRALHLHLSLVRHYTQHQRLAGPVEGVASSFLDTPWLWFVVPCMGRLDDLRNTADTLLAQPSSSYVLVDYSCPDEAGAWARTHHPAIEVIEVAGRSRFRGAEARNHGAAAATDDGVLCFLDADMRAARGFAETILSQFDAESYRVPDRKGPGYDTMLVCSKAAFSQVDGFDEVFLDWGEECDDLKAALRRVGVVERTFPASLVSPIDRHARTSRRFRAIPDGQVNRAIHGAYRRAKAAILDETGGDGIATNALHEVYAAITRHHLATNGLSMDVPCSAVAFHETMGYSVAQLEVGASSHTNDPRPFAAIPQMLKGLQFTQVVAGVVSPVQVEFLTSGKLYVLVGNDWDGHGWATAWLRNAGYREAVPPVVTRRGTGFEVWSLRGDAGQCFVLPTQVMLVAARLVRK